MSAGHALHPTRSRAPAETVRARTIRIEGRVQGVGFRPFVYRTAHAHGVAGRVLNRGGEVLIHAEGPGEALEAFMAALGADLPPLARITHFESAEAAPEGCAGFIVAESGAAERLSAHVPPDLFTCPACLEELRDPADRRYRYPFINCTDCGPRYTIIRGLPYDRPATSMAGFPLCEPCRAEYENPLDRRFHAEPVACPDCGPSLTWSRGGERVTDTEAAIAACIEALRHGEIVAVRGIGGYHLMCDAADEDAVARLRRRKARPHKPLAVMFPLQGADGLDAVRAAAHLEPEAEARLLDPARPILLVPAKQGNGLAPSLAPGLGDLGVFLPYSPLHHILLADFGRALVATSGNVSGEPVITGPDEAEARLGRVADAFVHHDRPIVRPADDSVYRMIGGRASPIRLGRGAAPVE
ncbi:MAG: Sua5/YciO/YrdC/YwlC family protein, partial [Alphaproteobacteria bacterium]